MSPSGKAVPSSGPISWEFSTSNADVCEIDAIQASTMTDEAHLKGDRRTLDFMSPSSRFRVGTAPARMRGS
jgi:hypothetical protein